MCGIVGYISPGDPHTEDAIVGMCHRLIHRGPDSEGYFFDTDAGVALGHRRLAVVDLSPEGHQPMFSGSGRYIIAYNGEIYNIPALKRDISRGGHYFNWRGHSDTEVLLAAIEIWGLEKALDKIVGMYAFALWDKKNKTLSIVRDRMGEKPLYYGWIDGTFLFSSELKALTVHPLWQGAISRQALSLYLRFGYIPSPHTIYKGFFKLPPGCSRTIRPGEASPGRGIDPEVKAYWSLSGGTSITRSTDLSPDESVDKLETLLRDSVRGQMVSDVPLGAFLSGGIDSSTIVALMQSQSERPIRTFTIGFHQTDYDEAGYARKISDYLGTDHTELYLSAEDAREVIPDLFDLYDEPFADSSQIPTYIVSRMTRKYVTVSLSGDGGDELFGGYNRYALTSDLWKKLARIPSCGRHLFARGLARLPVEFFNHHGKFLESVLSQHGRRGAVGQKLKKLSEVVANDSPDELYLSLISIWKKPELLMNGVNCPPPAWLKAAEGHPNLLERLTRYDLAGYLPDDILVKVDRAAMAVSLETRVPLLDHRIVEFALGLPSDMKVRGGSSKWILKQVLHRYVPEEFFNRPKRGFALPLGDWLRGPLREWAEELLGENRLKQEGLLEPGSIRAKWKEHLEGRCDWQGPLWTILMFQSWLQNQKRVEVPKETRKLQHLGSAI